MLCKKHVKTFYSLHYEKFQDGTVKCIEDEIPFEVPEGWAWSRLGTVFLTITGSTPSTKDASLYGDDFPFFKPTDLDAGFEVYSSESRVSEKGYFNGRSLPEQSVLVTCIGATIGKTGFIRKTGICNQQINAILPNEKIVSEYTFFTICSELEQQQILMNASATTLPILNKSKFDNLIFPIPPYKEQILIVEKLKEVLSYVDELNNARDSLYKIIKMVKNKILDLAIRGKLVPQAPQAEPASVLLKRIRAEKEELIKQGKIKRDKKESIIFKGEDNSYYEKIESVVRCINSEIPFKIPDSWSYERLGNICSVARGGSPRPIENYLTDDENGLNWIKIGDTEQGGKYIFSTKEKICPDGLSKTRYVHCGDFLLTNSMSFGRPYILKTDGCIHDGWLVIGNVETIFNQDFLYYMLSSSTMYNALSSLAVGSTVKNLKSDSVKSLLVPIPPLEEQKAIAAQVEIFFTITAQVEKRLS